MRLESHRDSRLPCGCSAWRCARIHRQDGAPLQYVLTVDTEAGRVEQLGVHGRHMALDEGTGRPVTSIWEGPVIVACALHGVQAATPVH